MGFPAVTYTFTNGSTADATQVNQNFTDIINGVSDTTENLSISALTTASTATFNSNVLIGISSSNSLTINASIAANVVFSANGSWDIGGSTIGAKSLYLGGSSTFTTRIIGAALSGSWTLTTPTSAGTARYRLETDGSGVTSWNPVRRTGSDAQNISFTATVGTNALTVALKTLVGGTDPSSTDPVDIVFRSATATTGTPVVRTVSGGLSVVAPDAQSLGLTTAVTSYLYIYAIDNAGTVELALSATSFWDEGSIQNTSAISSASSPSTLYSTIARTGVAVRRIGRIAINLAVSNHWSNAPTEISNIVSYPGSGVLFSANNTAGTSIGADAKIPFATVNWDTHAGWATDTYTVVVPGKYRITACVYTGSVSMTATQVFQLSFKQNSTEDLVGQREGNGSNHAISIMASKTYNCVAGDTLQVWMAVSVGVSLDTTAGRCYVNIERVGN